MIRGAGAGTKLLGPILCWVTHKVSTHIHARLIKSSRRRQPIRVRARFHELFKNNKHQRSKGRTKNRGDEKANNWEFVAISSGT